MIVLTYDIEDSHEEVKSTLIERFGYISRYEHNGRLVNLPATTLIYRDRKTPDLAVAELRGVAASFGARTFRVWAAEFDYRTCYGDGGPF